MPEAPACGILNVNKPSGLTSFDVVRVVKRGSGINKAGHAGTLDPAATGVLLVCLGQAVRISEYLMRLPKTYLAEITLGISTTTYDAEGEVTLQGDFSRVSEGDLLRVLEGFVGQIEQTPPAFSAIKTGGERAYRLARRGEAVALKPRRADIYAIRLLKFESPSVEVEVECGKGTYIRSLAHDIGERLGCGGHLGSLGRTRVGPFDVADGVTLEQLEPRLAAGDWRQHLLPMDYGLMHLPAVTLHIEDEKDLRHGQALHIDEDRTASLGEVLPGMECRAYAEDGSLAGIIRYNEEGGLWRARKVFAPCA
ncbi:MAG: tRNA pseudouridine(55) synthase TruB [Chloroflexi bacterium]|nr:MAG: tRNA pseudouridine(55) synthase TruB [Chloroflexota bacterium]